MSNSSDYNKKWEQEHREQRNQYKNMWRKKNRHKSFASIMCPYFISETAMQITCESVNVNEKCAVHKFKSKELKDKHRNCFCESFNYMQCMHNSII